MGRGRGRGRGKGKGKGKKPVGKGKEKASEADVEMKDDQQVHMWLQNHSMLIPPVKNTPPASQARVCDQ